LPAVGEAVSSGAWSSHGIDGGSPSSLMKLSLTAMPRAPKPLSSGTRGDYTSDHQGRNALGQVKRATFVTAIRLGLKM
jgi:hypothetical protein